MAIDPRLIMSPQFAEHLWLTSASNGITGYYINKKGQAGGPDNTYNGGELKMGGNEDRIIKNILNAVSGTDILNFKKEKKRKNSQWDITKVNGFAESDSLQGIATSPNWGWDIYFKDERGTGKKLGRFEFQLIHHEIGHSIGLSHPGNNGTNPNYSMADTVMSYNVVVDSNNAVVPFGYTTSDASAIRGWWNDSGFEKLENTKPEDVGDFKVIQPDVDDHDHADHSHFKLETERKPFPSIQLDLNQKNKDFNKIWIENSQQISDKLRTRRGGSSPLVVDLSKDDDIVDFNNWTGDGLDSDVSVGHLLVKGKAGDDTFILRGNERFKNGIIGKDLVISGGKGFDTVIIDSAFDFPNAKAGELLGNKVIRFFGDTQKIDLGGGKKVINADPQQGVIIRNDVDMIRIGDQDFTFNQLYDLVKGM